MKAELDVSKTVKKSNLLNEIRNANASLVEYRLFCVYLAHLSMNTEDNVVTFPLADYARIAGLDRPRYADLKTQSDNMLKMTAAIKTEDGGFVNRNLFSEFRLFKENEQWMVSLECNVKIAPLIREQKGRFLRYKLYNTIYLRSYNQQRIYELLKQYEKIGVRLIDLPDLRAYLSIRDDEYPVWGVFSRDVLKVAQKALKENTDIYFEYQPVKKGRKVVAVRFDVYKNEAFIDQLHIDDFLPEQPIEVEYEGEEFEAHSNDEDEELYKQKPIDVTEQLEGTGEQELTVGERYRKECIAILRDLMKDHFNYSDDELSAVVAAIQNSSWWDINKGAWLGNFEARDRAFYKYASAQYAYSKLNSKAYKADNKRSFINFLLLAVKDNYADISDTSEEKDDSNSKDDFFDAALRRAQRYMNGQNS